MIKKIVAGLLAFCFISTGTTFADVKLSSKIFLKKGYKSSTVTSLQQRLNELGYLAVNPTGYYGNLTLKAVKSFQSDSGLSADGIVGRRTVAELNTINTKAEPASAPAEKAPSTGVFNTSTLDWTWFGTVKSKVPHGSTIKILDINSGTTFNAKKTYGSNHADVETLTKGDTATLKSILGGSWTWTRRPVVVYYNGYAIPASMAAYPHAGNDGAKATSYTSWRSGGYGGGTNLDAVKNNNMHGVIDIHFKDSKTHGSNRVDSNHQNAVKKAANYIKNNY